MPFKSPFEKTFNGIPSPFGRRLGVGQPFGVSITGLTGGLAVPGDEASIGYTITPDNGTETVAWGTAPGDATYGTGASPTDYTAGDGGSLYLTVTDGGESVPASAPIRYVQATAPTITAAPQITATPAQGATVGIVSATASGTQPITITDTLALGSGDVTGDISGGQYTIPPTATVGQTLTLTSVASNGISPDAQDSVSVTVYSEAQFYSYRTEQIDP